MATPIHDAAKLPRKSTRTVRSHGRRREPPRASRRSVFEIFLTALEEIDRLAQGSSYGDLPTFTQDWLKGRVSDYGNALSLMRTWGLLGKSGNLNPDFVDRAREAHEAQQYAHLRQFLREQFRTGYEDLLADRAEAYDPAVFDRFGEVDFDSKRLRHLPGISDETEPQTRDKREQCLASVSDVIRYCHDRAVLAKEAAHKGPAARPASGGPCEDEKGPETANPAIFPRGSRTAVVTHRSFNMRNESHQHVSAEVWFNVPANSYWLEQLGLRLLDWADQLREQERK